MCNTDKENDIPREVVSEFPGRGKMPNSTNSLQVMSSPGLDEDDDRCYYELCGGGTSVDDIDQFEKPLNEGMLVVTLIYSFCNTD